MAIDKKVANLLNQQINKELFSAYLYVGIADYFEDRGLPGFAHWYLLQAHEEVDHAKIIRRFLLNNEYRPTLELLEKPEVAFGSDMDALRAALEHEVYVTASIHEIYALAEKVQDYRSQKLLDWFVEEQGEEETNAHEMIRNMELFGIDGPGLYALDREYAARPHAEPNMPM